MASSSSITLDDLETSPAPATTGNDHLSYPAMDDRPQERSKSPNEEPARTLLKDRLYIGNLHPTVDEYTLLQVFSKFGKVTKLDFLFHKSGALKGKPRGYAFIEYGNKDDALKALSMAHEKPLRGRKLVVTYAHQAPLDQHSGIGLPSSLRSRRAVMDTGRPTTLSIMKTGIGNRNEGKTLDKIAMMEAKLRQMESTNPKAKSISPSHEMPMDTDSTTTTPNSSLPYHPSLPMKPPPPLPQHVLSLPMKPPPPLPQHLSLALDSNPKPIPNKPKTPLPSLPMLPSSISKSTLMDPKLAGANAHPKQVSSTSQPSASSASHHPKAGKPLKLVGVKIKAKEKPQS